MAISDDVFIDYTNKIIEVRNNRYTVNQLYSYLMETFDDQAQMDNLIPIQAKTPTLYDFINGWQVSTLSWDFLYNSAVEVQVNGANTLDVYTNVRTLGAIESGTELYIQQGTIVPYEAHTAFNPESTLSPSNTILIVTATEIPTNTPASGELEVDVWGVNTTWGPETLNYSSWSNNTFIVSEAPSGTYDPSAGTFVIYAPLSGHIDILFQTTDDGSDIEGTTFSTYARKFQDTYDKFTTTGGAVVANVPVATGTDPQLTLTAATLDAFTGLTIMWCTDSNYFKRSCFDGTDGVEEYTLESAMDNSQTFAVTSATIAASVASSGYLQIEDEVCSYSSWVNGAKGTFTLSTRGTMETAAASHLAGKALSTHMYDYEVIIHSAEGHTLKQMYNWIQYQLLKKTDIDDGTGVHYGWMTDELVVYTGKMFTNTGIWLDGMASTDKSNISYKDVNAATHDPPTYVVLKITASDDMNGGRAAMYRLSGPYNADTFDPETDIVATLIDTTLSGGKAETTIKYIAQWYVLSRTRKAGYLPFELGGQLPVAADYTVASINPEDTIYTP